MSQEGLRKKRHRRNHAEFSQLLWQHLASGLRRQEFCRRHGLPLSTLLRRLARMRSSGAQAAASSGWVAVEISPPAEPLARSLASGLALLVGPYRIELTRGFDAASLRQLLSLLEGR